MTGPFDSLRRNSKKLKHRFSKKHGSHNQLATVTDDPQQSQHSFTYLPSSHSVPNLSSLLKRTSGKNKSSVSFDLTPETIPEFRRHTSTSRRHSVDQVGTVIDIRKKRGLSLSPPPRPVTLQIPTSVHNSQLQRHSSTFSRSDQSLQFSDSIIPFPSHASKKRVFSDSSLNVSSNRSRTRPQSLIFDDLHYRLEQGTSFYKLPASQAKSTSSLLTMTKQNVSPSFIIPRNPNIIKNRNSNITNNSNNSNDKKISKLHDETIHILETPFNSETIPDMMLSLGFFLFNFIFSIFFYLPIFIVTRFSHLSILIASFSFIVWYTNGWLWTLIPNDSTI
ncbi:hypothetical protein CANINC_000971 [Pichia inconspicua]|uniref:Uncharacterized protein n=1 Tax=Pichia inconspicua TaxID=52247 RepID=A0A4V4NG36_9ASCO|nr:hypothetical protein CANINC_000971 [[Candida] inconspicua]